MMAVYFMRYPELIYFAELLALLVLVVVL